MVAPCCRLILIHHPLEPAAGRHGHFAFLRPQTRFKQLIATALLTQWTAIEYIGDDDEVGLEAFFSMFLFLEDRQGSGAGYSYFLLLACSRLLLSLLYFILVDMIFLGDVFLFLSLFAFRFF